MQRCSGDIESKGLLNISISFFLSPDPLSLIRISKKFIKGIVMKKRTQYLIDREFQRKTSFKIVGVVSIVIALVVLSAGIIITINNNDLKKNNDTIANNTQNIRKTMQLQQNLFISFSSLRSGTPGKSTSKSGAGLIKNYNSSIEKLNSAMNSNDKIIESNQTIMKINDSLLVVMILIIVVGLIFLYVNIIRHTHRISGPIFLMSRYIKEILNGGSPEIRDLRIKDDFQEFYSLFRQMAERLMELEEKELEK